MTGAGAHWATARGLYQLRCGGDGEEETLKFVIAERVFGTRRMFEELAQCRGRGSHTDLPYIGVPGATKAGRAARADMVERPGAAVLIRDSQVEKGSFAVRIPRSIVTRVRASPPTHRWRPAPPSRRRAPRAPSGEGADRPPDHRLRYAPAATGPLPPNRSRRARSASS